MGKSKNFRCIGLLLFGNSFIAKVITGAFRGPIAKGGLCFGIYPGFVKAEKARKIRVCIHKYPLAIKISQVSLEY